MPEVTNYKRVWGYTYTSVCANLITEGLRRAELRERYSHIGAIYLDVEVSYGLLTSPKFKWHGPITELVPIPMGHDLSKYQEKIELVVELAQQLLHEPATGRLSAGLPNHIEQRLPECCKAGFRELWNALREWLINPPVQDEEPAPAGAEAAVEVS